MYESIVPCKLNATSIEKKESQLTRDYDATGLPDESTIEAQQCNVAHCMSQMDKDSLEHKSFFLRKIDLMRFFVLEDGDADAKSCTSWKDLDPIYLLDTR